MWIAFAAASIAYQNLIHFLCISIIFCKAQVNSTYYYNICAMKNFCLLPRKCFPLLSLYSLF